MKASAYPGAVRLARRTMRRHGRRRTVLTTLQIGSWSASFSVVGVGVVRVPTVRVQRQTYTPTPTR